MNGGKIRVFNITVENGVESVQRGGREAAGGPSGPFRPARKLAATAPLLALRATSPVSGESVLKGEALAGFARI